MVYGRTLIWHDWALNDSTQNYYYDLGLEPNRVHNSLLPLQVLITNQSQGPTTCNAMIRRHIVDQVGGTELQFRGLFEDQVLFAKVMLNYPIYVSDLSWAKYRQHDQSLCARTNIFRTHWAELRYLRWLRRYLKARRRDARTEQLIASRQQWLYLQLVKAGVTRVQGSIGPWRLFR